MTRRVVAVALLAALPGVAWGAGLVDVYIRGELLGRAPGRNAARVAVRWDYKCLGDKLGDATYDWTLNAIRRDPKPEVRVVIARGTTKRGSTLSQLAPGRWQLVADPFTCQTERGAGWSEPELGASITVPDYCTWVVASGSATVEQGGVVKRLAAKGTVRPGDIVVTGSRAVTLKSRGDRSAAAVAGRSRVGVELRHCARTGGWRLEVERGSAVISAAGAPRLPYLVVTPHAFVSGPAGRWRLTVGARTTVRVLSGKALVWPNRSGKAGPPVSLGAGRQVVLP